MADDRLRRRIAYLAAQLMYDRTESEYFTAKRKAARSLGLDPKGRPGDLPKNAEIREQVQALARLHEGPARETRLREMRIDALRMMRRLARFRPRLIGSVWTGHVRKGSDVDLHVFGDSLALLTSTLDEYGLNYEVERKRVIKHAQERVFTHIHVDDRFPFELTLYAEAMAHYVFRSSITGGAIERASVAELEEFLRTEDPDGDLDGEVDGAEDPADRFELYATLLKPLEDVRQSPKHHPEGDALYHSLQVFGLAREARPYDEEFLLAALLHDVGKAIDPGDHVRAGVQALEGAITPRTEALIAAHMDAHAYRAGALGARAAARLRASDDFDDLMLLRDLDRRGRVPGAEVCEPAEALRYLRGLERACDFDDPDLDEAD